MNLYLKVTDDAKAWGGDDFNLTDNEYFEVKAYIADNKTTDSERKPLEGEVKLVKCTNDQLDKFFHGTSAYYYRDRTICFENLDKMSITSDWWVRGNYYSIVVAIETCKPTNEKNCANETER